MSNRLKALCLAVSAVILSPVLAENPVLQITESAWSGPTVTVYVQNASAETVSGRVLVTVLLNDETVDTLSSGHFSVAGGETVPVTLTASRPVVRIEDNPEPIGLVD